MASRGTINAMRCAEIAHPAAPGGLHRTQYRVAQSTPHETANTRQMRTGEKIVMLKRKLVARYGTPGGFWIERQTLYSLLTKVDLLPSVSQVAPAGRTHISPIDGTRQLAACAI